MNELSRRANDVVARLCDGLILDDHHADEAADLIEQALLAERRLAMEACAEIAAKVRDDRRMEYTGREIATTYNDGLMFGTEVVEQALRAAAEKEVGK